MSEVVEVKRDGEQYQKIVEINVLYDDIEKVKEIMKAKGVIIEPLPDIELGNLALDNIHINYTRMEYKIKTEEGFTIPLFITKEGLQEAKLDKNLVIQAMIEQESLLRYAESVRKEYEDMTDKELLKYDCIGSKRYARSRDECLRRKLIEKVGE